MPPPVQFSTAAPQSLSRNVPVLGVVSLLMGMSSAMIYGVLPIFLVVVVGASTASVGFIEGIAEATNSFVKILSGVMSDRIRFRKPLVVLGYALSAVNKLLFPIAETASMVLLARVADRIGKGVRDAPRDAFMTDMTPMAIRGSGFGLRLALYTIGAVLGPLTAMAIMSLSGDNFRLVFWIALIPGFASVAVLLLWVKEEPRARPEWAGRRCGEKTSELFQPHSGGSFRSQPFCRWRASVRLSWCSRPTASTSMQPSYRSCWWPYTWCMLLSPIRSVYSRTTSTGMCSSESAP